MKTFLHIGCGQKRKNATTPGFNRPEWKELRLDIDEKVKPDIIGTMLDMAEVTDASIDAIFSSHNIEHLYAHEVPVAMAEFKRVLKADGFVIITCPDIQGVAELIAADKLLEPAYSSPAGPVAPVDILYGFRPELERGNHYMAHRCAFTQRVLRETLQGSGFAKVATLRRKSPYFELWALATVNKISDAEIRQLAQEHLPMI